jgi:solute carrier family 31 (copper transporter), member 1
MHLVAQLSLLLTFFISSVLAHENGMVMSMDQGMVMDMGNMIAYLHFTIGDNLWYLGWAPRSTGAMVGTCIGLFILAIAERWLAMMRGVMEAHWNTRLDLRICLSCTTHAQVMQCPDFPRKQSQYLVCGVVSRRA